jgi:hypothetical protein
MGEFFLLCKSKKIKTIERSMSSAVVEPKLQRAQYFEKKCEWY